MQARTGSPQATRSFHLAGGARGRARVDRAVREFAAAALGRREAYRAGRSREGGRCCVWGAVRCGRRERPMARDVLQRLTRLRASAAGRTIGGDVTTGAPRTHGAVRAHELELTHPGRDPSFATSDVRSYPGYVSTPPTPRCRITYGTGPPRAPHAPSAPGTRPPALPLAAPLAHSARVRPPARAARSAAALRLVVASGRPITGAVGDASGGHAQPGEDPGLEHPPAGDEEDELQQVAHAASPDRAR